MFLKEKHECPSVMYRILSPSVDETPKDGSLRLLERSFTNSILNESLLISFGKLLGLFCLSPRVLNMVCLSKLPLRSRSMSFLEGELM